MNILALSGSLRQGSSNTTLLHAAAALAPDGVAVTVYERLGDIPPFNPDLDENAPEPVQAFRAVLRAADAVLICSPEYAHGVSGVMKNALDWTVGSGEFIQKPVALLNAAPWATFAHSQLTETIKTMDARVVEEACVAVKILPKNLGVAGMVASPEIAPVLRAAVAALALT
ncbi:MAG: NADPH-dependent FMN reductase [Capsulimonas sp.]|uniref:NADPH-dependent FMN reductase n=1 Tax=Capsulimonas sp. TaxID=2494211 RepID=UPI003262E0D4